MKKPNIIFILLDDMGWRDLSCYGSAFYETPNIDRMKSEGMLFTDAYAACPVCSPSRASIMTGKYPATVGITDWICGGHFHPARGRLVDVPYLKNLPESEATSASLLREAGYSTWHVGKWHLGTEGTDPCRHGFDVNIGGCEAGSPGRGYFSPWTISALKDADVPDGTFLTDHLTDRAMDLVRNRGDKPFFLNFWMYAVHTPIDAKPEKIRKYEEKAKRLGLDKVKAIEEGEHFPCEHKKHLRVERRTVQSDPVYAALIESVDENVGRLLDLLEAEGIADNTVIFFTSDNGGLSSAEGSPTCNAPLAEGKGWMYDGGTREPLLVRWPRRIAAGSACSVPVTSPDFLPTLLEMAGVPVPAGLGCEGVSILPLLEGKKAPEREAIFWHYPHYGNQGGTPAAAVRAGRYKLIRFYEDERMELYDLENDIGEETDLAAAMPDEVRRLDSMLSAWLESVEARMPVVNPYYEPTGGNRAAVEPMKNVSQETSCRLHARKVSVSPGWDVIVAGGGPAGCAAAVAAAREGARTLLVEGTWALGGMGTSGLVPALCPFTDGKRIIYGGIAERVLKACKAALPNHPLDRNDWVPINPEALKRTYDALVHQYGARVLFGVNVAGVETDGAGRVARLIAASKAGLTAFEGTAIVDATGDGDVAAWAGAGFEKGSADGDLQPATHCFILANVDLNELAKVGLRQDPLNRILESGKYPLIVDRHLCYSAIGPGTVGFNAGHVWGVDNTEPESVTMAAFKGREIALQFRNALAEVLPAAFKDAYLVSTGAMVGVRETRRITGDYVLVMDDFAGRKSFDDEICRNAYFIDVHPEKHASVAGVDPGKIGFKLNPGESHGVPYRCLTPKGLVNVLVAGRCISSDRPVQGSVRVMPVCLATGEAAGIAAALAARCGGDVRGFDVQRLRRRLREEGAYLP